MIIKEYDGGIYKSYITYTGRINKNGNVLDQLPTRDGQALEFGYHTASVETRKPSKKNKCYAFFSYLTMVGYFVVDEKKKEIRYYDFSYGYSPTTSKQATMFKNWLRLNREGYPVKVKSYTDRSIAAKRLEKGLF